MLLRTLLATLIVPLSGAEGDPTIPGLSLTPGGLLRDPPVEVWLSETNRLERGDRVRVYARADMDGYLLILHAEPGGRIRVLFPLDPLDDHYVRGRETYEALGRADRAAFQVMESVGSGTVFAAFSRDPFRFDQLVRGDHWDYTLDTWAIGDDAEGDLVRLAEIMAAGAPYEYDLIRYEVNRYVTHGRYGSRLGLYVGSHYGRSWFGVSWGDPYYYSSSYYAPYYDHYYYRPYRYAYYYDPFYPFWYDPCWSGWCYYRSHYYWYGPRYHRGYYYAHVYHRDFYYRDRYWRGGGYWYDGGRYAFKGGSSPRGIEPRSRAPLASAVTRRLLSPEETRTGALGRRTLGVNTAAQPVNGASRRGLTPQQGQGTPRRAAPAVTTPRRTAEPVRQAPDATRTPVRNATPAQPDRRQIETDAGRREVQDPRRVTPETRQAVPPRQAEPRRGGELNRRELSDRMARPQEPQARPPRETTRPRLERREPPRQAEPRAAPRAEPRSAPPPRAEPRSPPAPRAEPRSAPAPRATPRSNPPPRAAPRSAAPQNTPAARATPRGSARRSPSPRNSAARGPAVRGATVRSPVRGSAGRGTLVRRSPPRAAVPSRGSAPPVRSAPPSRPSVRAPRGSSPPRAAPPPRRRPPQ